MFMAKHIGRAATVLALIAATGLIVPGCKTNPATGKSIYAPLTPQQELALGEQTAPQMTQEFGGAVPDQQVQTYVTQIGLKLSKQTESNYPNLPWQFTVLNSSVVNAFSLPGGKVFITRGLMERMTNEAQLAGVLGHEIGHVTAQHVSQQVGQQQIEQAGLGVAGVAVSQGGSSVGSLGGLIMPALNVGGQLVLLKFSRTDETQADELGMRYMTRAGYNPKAQLEVMQILQSLGGGSDVEMLQTHPLPATRIKDVQHKLDTTYKDVVNNPNYGFYPERYAPILADLKRLPPPPAPKPTPPASGGSQIKK
jgi:predicted Zn-dependent protease